MSARALRGVAVLFPLFTTLACQTPRPSAEPAAPVAAEAAGEDAAPAPATADPAPEEVAAPAPATQTAPDSGPPPECAGRLQPEAPRELNVGGRAATSTGFKLTFKDPDADGKLILGVLGPINEDSGANLFVLRRYLQFFKEEKADAVVVSGDVGEVGPGIERAVSELAAAAVPVLVVSGNRECRADFHRGVARAQKKHPNVVNMNLVRAVEFQEATVVSLPGYHDPNFISCTTGCQYNQSTLDEVVSLARSAKNPVVLVSHGPPKGSSNRAVDYAVNGGNAGDPQINRAMSEGKIRFGIFSNIKEAGARATDLEGTSLIPQDKAARELYLNPGPADTTRWDMNDRTQGYGFAATLTIQGDKASWKLYRSVKLTKEQKLEAKKMDPPRNRDEPPDEAAEAAP
jgi:Icc-related predicted phosphoesterase